MKVGISCIITPSEWSFAEMLKKCPELGYEAVELVIRDAGELTLDTEPAQLARMAAEAQTAGVELASVALLAGSVNIMSNDATIRSAAMVAIERGLHMTQALGADTMLITPGTLGPDCHYDDAYFNALTSLCALAPTVEEIGVNLALEYVWNWFLVSPLEYRHFLDDVDCPQIGFYFDSGNMVIQSYPEQWTKILGRHIKKVHLKDFRRSDYSWRPLTEGDVDFPAVMTELRNIGYDDVLLSEVDAGTAPFEETATTIRRIIEM